VEAKKDGEVVTEQEWLAATDPQAMLKFVRGKVSNRSLRLFAVACCRLRWEWLEPGVPRQTVEVAERYADGLATVEELAVAQNAFLNAEVDYRSSSWAYGVTCADAWIAACSLCGKAGEVIQDSVSRKAVEEARCRSITGKAVGRMAKLAVRAAKEAAAATETAILRDVLNHSLFLINLDKLWLTHTIEGLAGAAYFDRTMPAGTLDPDRLAVLADALEDAGCTDATILDHLRGPGPHVRGCFVIDLLLDKT
jgi:hypothetical protein